MQNYAKLLLVWRVIPSHGIAKIGKPRAVGGSIQAMEHRIWLEKITDDSVLAISKSIGVANSTLVAQLNKQKISADHVVKIAEHYDLHPVGALVDTGYIHEKWARTVDPVQALREVTEDQLADELLRRMKLGQNSGALKQPVDELVARRGLDFDQAVADSSAAEPEPGSQE